MTDESPYLTLLRDTVDAVAVSATLDEALATTVTIVAQRLAYDVCSIYLMNDAGELVLHATHGLRKESIGRVRMRPSEGLTGLIAETERAFFMSRADEHPRFKFFPETGEERFRSFGGVPLMQRGRCIGVLTVQTVREYAFHANEMVLLQAVASQVVSLVDVTRRLQPAHKGAPARARGMLVGLGTSPGIGLGRVVALGVDPHKGPPAARPSLGTDEETKKFKAARDSAVRALDALAAQFSKEHAGGIFRAHQELLQDPEIEERVLGHISQGEPVERAVHFTIDELAQVFRGRQELREKAHDLDDVRTHLLRALGVGARREVTATPGEKIVVLAEFLTPAETAHLDPTHVVAVVTEHGSATSHASILARSLGIPAVVAIPDLCATVASGEKLLVDGDNGFVFYDPDPTIEAEYAKRSEAARAATLTIQRELEARIAKGPTVRDVLLLANSGLPIELAKAREGGAMGIGLLRTEFYFLQQKTWPTVKEQVAFYRRAFAAAPRGPIVVRLLDAGGDKELPYVEPRGEPNPILGLRSVRFLLAHPEPCRNQIRALLEAAAAENADVKLLVPLVTAPWELAAVREMMLEVSAKEGLPPRAIGMMVEAPSVLYQLDDLVPLADFVSVGTNDLTQYLLAVDRDNELVRHYYSPYHPAVVRALAVLCSTLSARGFKASICGEMAGEPLGALALLALGYRSLSVRPRALQALKCLVHCIPESALAPLGAQLVVASTAEEIERILRKALRESAPFLLEA